MIHFISLLLVHFQIVHLPFPGFLPPDMTFHEAILLPHSFQITPSLLDLVIHCFKFRALVLVLNLPSPIFLPLIALKLHTITLVVILHALLLHFLLFEIIQLNQLLHEHLYLQLILFAQTWVHVLLKIITLPYFNLIRPNSYFIYFLRFLL